MNQRGVTLTEVIIVIAVFVIVLAFAAPSLQRWRHDAAVKGVAYDIMSGLRKARSMAISDHSTVTVTVSPGNHQLSIGTSVISLSEEVDFEVKINSGDAYAGADVDIDFYPSGVCGSTLFVLVNNDSNLCVKIESKTTGLARM